MVCEGLKLPDQATKSVVLTWLYAMGNLRFNIYQSFIVLNGIEQENDMFLHSCRWLTGTMIIKGPFTIYIILQPPKHQGLRALVWTMCDGSMEVCHSGWIQGFSSRYPYESFVPVLTVTYKVYRRWLLYPNYMETFDNLNVILSFQTSLGCVMVYPKLEFEQFIQCLPLRCLGVACENLVPRCFGGSHVSWKQPALGPVAFLYVFSHFRGEWKHPRCSSLWLKAHWLPISYTA